MGKVKCNAEGCNRTEYHTGMHHDGISRYWETCAHCSTETEGTFDSAGTSGFHMCCQECQAAIHTPPRRLRNLMLRLGFIRFVDD